MTPIPRAALEACFPDLDEADRPTAVTNLLLLAGLGDAQALGPAEAARLAATCFRLAADDVDAAASRMEPDDLAVLDLSGSGAA